MNLHYYYIKVQGHLRCEKASSPREACKLAFGVVYDHPTDTALYKDIGTRKPRYLSCKKLLELQDSPEGWLPIPPK